MARQKFKINVDHDLDMLIRYVQQLHNEKDFTQVVLEGISAIQRFQRKFSPKGKRQSIPRSIKPARIVRSGNTVSATSQTNLPQAIFTNEGTGQFGPSGQRYVITQERRYSSGPRRGEDYVVNIDHPGIRGTHWWERGMSAGSTLALQSFRRKVGRILRFRG